MSTRSIYDNSGSDNDGDEQHEVMIGETPIMPDASGDDFSTSNSFRFDVTLDEDSYHHDEYKDTQVDYDMGHGLVSAGDEQVDEELQQDGDMFIHMPRMHHKVTDAEGRDLHVMLARTELRAAQHAPLLVDDVVQALRDQMAAIDPEHFVLSKKINWERNEVTLPKVRAFLKSSVSGVSTLVSLDKRVDKTRGNELWWNALPQTVRRLFIAVATIWLEKLMPPGLLVLDMADIFGLDVDVVVTILSEQFPNLNFEPYERRGDTIASVLKEIGDLAGFEMQRSTNLSLVELPPLEDFIFRDTDESLLFSSLSTFLHYLNLPSTLSDIVVETDKGVRVLHDILVTESKLLGDDKRERTFVRGQELLTAYLVAPKELFWRSYMCLWGQEKKCPLSREVPLSGPPMFYSKLYPRQKGLTLTFILKLGSDASNMFQGTGYMVKQVNHPLAPLDVTRFTVCQVYFSAPMSARVLLGLVERRMTSGAHCTLSVEGSSSRLGFDTSFFLDGNSFIFCIGNSVNFESDEKTSTGLHGYAIPVLMRIGNVSVCTAPNMISPLKIYRILKRALSLKADYQEIVDATRADIAASRAQGKEVEDYTYDAYAKVSLSRFLLHMDHSFAGMRAFLCVMVAMGIKESNFGERVQLNNIAQRLLSTSPGAYLKCKNIFENNYKPKQRKAREALSIAMAYFHILTTVRLYIKAKKIVNPPMVRESTDVLTSMNSTLTWLLAAFNNDNVLNAYLDSMLAVDTIMSDFVDETLIML